MKKNPNSHPHHLAIPPPEQKHGILAYFHPWQFYLVWLFATIFLTTISPLTSHRTLWLFLCIFILILFIMRPHSPIYYFRLTHPSILTKICIIFAAFATIAICTIPMHSSSPLGEHDGRRQYSEMADNLLAGRISFDYGDETELLQLQNPYDPNERRQTGVKFHWDYAFYNGKYYMYFGIVPTIILFLPYRIITGTPLDTIVTTQIFVAIFILGIFVLFYFLSKRFFNKLPLATYLLLSISFSIMCVWFSTAQPPLYCTAITSALAMEVWSIFFYALAIWGKKTENRQILFAFFGALLGSLAFGCRPPIALINLVAIPFLIIFLKQHRFNIKLFAKICLVALPYIIVGISLMCYNYVRFDNPLEFGQAYQLTADDQTSFGFNLSAQTLLQILNEGLNTFFGLGTISNTFPFINAAGIFFNFPILLLCFILFSSKILTYLSKKQLLPIVIGLICAVILITALDIMWTPYMLERYHMDFYFPLSIICFIIIGAWYQSSSHSQQSLIRFLISILTLLTLSSSFLLYTGAIDLPEHFQNIVNFLHLS